MAEAIAFVIGFGGGCFVGLLVGLELAWSHLDRSRRQQEQMSSPHLCGNDAETVAEKPKEKPLKSTA